jgi:RimJ/RimL family protein N-acetyltransferase
MLFETDFIKLYEELNDINSSIEYRPISDIELFKQYANEIFGGYGGLTDSSIKDNTKEIWIDNKLVGYIAFSAFEEAGSKSLGFGNFMILERGQGLGTKVLQDIVANNKNEYDLIFCFVDANNEGAIRLYKKLGKVYDEEGLNDNGEYFVTFYDNGRWQLDN